MLTVLTTTDLNRLPSNQLGREIENGCPLSTGIGSVSVFT